MSAHCVKLTLPSSREETWRGKDGFHEVVITPLPLRELGLGHDAGVDLATDALDDLSAPAAFAQISDPAIESICDTWEFQGKAAGSCNAYCEAMDCDADAPMASETTGARVHARIMAVLPPGTPFPSCADNDADVIDLRRSAGCPSAISLSRSGFPCSPHRFPESRAPPRE